MVEDNYSKIICYNNTSLCKYLEKEQLVLVGGCFDLLHYGHIQFLRKAKAQGKHLIIALEPDETITNYKKRRAIHSQLQRAEILSSLSFVDKVIMLPLLKGFDDYNQLVQNICPSIIAVTKNDPQLSNKRIQAKLIGAQLIEVTDLVKNQEIQVVFSTDNILNMIDSYDQKMDYAYPKLARSYGSFDD
ncbi:adenylyltransferase/cytidyltransferase family protein [Rickettsia endosymbiont of Culicoides newsteadi]|uniref:adenylyltransferase/cytidyltransferase family protein n=1 Tax=Rickettsia endosymbiont of Culicoides newsteadi TaxID=1961830 RepID=UPI000B9A6526|nr:adenylyltransferase/cytidyltransferase family protein [Rickettsia endosymbiont of Culicoides newsteadi]OZG31299.1 glycerol-3-phosphate cytidyltransferase [Rickettsia endosymbiont of Culicoides newsteadi]